MISKQHKNLNTLAGVMLLAAVGGAPAFAKVDQAQADKLGGKELTVTGAEVAGNKDGTIPAYTGGLKDIPSCYKNDNWLCDPFPQDKPLFVITAQNVSQYASKLSPGQISLFKTYPDYKMPVYPTRRTFRMTDEAAAITKKNAVQTEALGVTGLKNYTPMGYPFPITTSGVEMVWNHIARWRGTGVSRFAGQATPQTNGAYNLVMFHDEVVIPAAMTDYVPGEDPNVMFYGKQTVVYPPRLAGDVLLVHETIDQVAEPRRAWIYSAGQRRVRRAPQVAYDGPGVNADGLRTADNYDLFNGSPDRYNWAFKGKKEMYIAYNSYKLDQKGVPYDDIIKPGHINQDLTRYELHRVYEVEATLREGMRHIYAKRVFYFDEDSWMAAVIDHYDTRGNLWRVAESHELLQYQIPVQGYAVETLNDLSARRYLVLGLKNNEPTGTVWDAKYSKQEFQPGALRREGVK
ncbi:MAG TPA: DUF1329 domain-containing protein [Pseudomonadales bacterium]|nr:DUF1329 domain-containing protein [Pseudomonadales bacterium]